MLLSEQRGSFTQTLLGKLLFYLLKDNPRLRFHNPSRYDDFIGTRLRPTEVGLEPGLGGSVNMLSLLLFVHAGHVIIERTDIVARLTTLQ